MSRRAERVRPWLPPRADVAAIDKRLIGLVAAGTVEAIHVVAYAAMVAEANSDPDYGPVGDLVMSARQLAERIGVHHETAASYQRRLRAVWLVELLVTPRGRRRPKWNVGDPSRALALLELPVDRWADALCDVDAHDAALEELEAERDRDRRERGERHSVVRPDLRRPVVARGAPQAVLEFVATPGPPQTLSTEDDVVADRAGFVADAEPVVADRTDFVADLDPTLIDQGLPEDQKDLRARERDVDERCRHLAEQLRARGVTDPDKIKSIVEAHRAQWLREAGAA